MERPPTHARGKGLELRRMQEAKKKKRTVVHIGKAQEGVPITTTTKTEDRGGPMWDLVTGITCYLWESLPDMNANLFSEDGTWASVARAIDQHDLMSIVD